MSSAFLLLAPDRDHCAQKGSMQVGGAVTPAWSRSKLHSTSLCRRVCGLRRTATSHCNRTKQTPSAIVRIRCASPEPASERHSEHHDHARLICSLLAAVTLVSLARAESTRNDCIGFVCWRGKTFVVCLRSLHGHCDCHAGHLPSLCLRQGWVHPARPVSGYGGGDAAADTVTSENRAVFSA